MGERPDPVTAAHAVAEDRYPEASAAFVGGSALRGEGTPTSDLDMVIISTEPPAPYRETFAHMGWTVEAFVHSERTLRIFSDRDEANRIPVLARIATEGEIVRDSDGVAQRLRSEMVARLDTGPEPLSHAELDRLRYEVTDALDDLADSRPGLERIVVAADVMELLGRVVLTTHSEWWGQGKWMVRRIGVVDQELAIRLQTALRRSVSDDASDLIALAEELLEPLGGRLLHGYRADGTQLMERWLRSQGHGD